MMLGFRFRCFSQDFTRWSRTFVALASPAADGEGAPVSSQWFTRSIGAPALPRPSAHAAGCSNASIDVNLYGVSCRMRSYPAWYQGFTPPWFSAMIRTFFLALIIWRRVGAGVPGTHV